MCDDECSHTAQVADHVTNVTGFPSSLTVAATWNRTTAKRYGILMAQVTDAGVSIVLKQRTGTAV